MQSGKARMGTQTYNCSKYLKNKQNHQQQQKANHKYGKCVETGQLSIILSKNHADQMMPDVLGADENCVIPRMNSTPASLQWKFCLV